MITSPNWKKNKIVKVKCVRKLGNFIYGKVYTAEAWSYNKHTGEYSMHRVIDEEGDLYSIEIGRGKIDRIFVLVREEINSEKANSE